MEKHVVICDRCGKKEEMIVDSFGVCFPPKDWGGPDDYDLCPKCAEEYESYSNDYTKRFIHKGEK